MQPAHVALRDHETCVLDVGSGEPLVLVHAIGLDREAWRGVVDALPEGRRIAYDLRGHGCAAGAPRPFTLRDLADDLVALLDALALDRVRLAGLSLGGAVAQEFALAYPERLEWLALVCTTGVTNPAYLERAEAAETHGVEPSIPATLERWFTAEALAADEPFVDYARERLRAVDPADFAAAWRALAGVDTLDRLGGVDVPTKVIAGDRDRSTPASAMEELAARLPRATFHVVAGGPHMLALERPHELAALLAA